ncbi:MAG: M42 family metallopeptidase [Bacilli bacterium]
MRRLFMNLKLLKEYTDAAAPAGFEKEAFEVMKNHISPHSDDITKDNLGSLIALKKGNGENLPKVMLAGHLDEIGFMITKIDDNGFLKFQPLGGWWGQVMLSQKMEIVNSEGKRFIAVIGSKPPHTLSETDKTKPMSIDNMYLDMGVGSKKEVEELGIVIGDFVVPYCEFSQMANKKYLLAKAWDNRIGCYFVGEVFKRTKKEDLNVDLYGVGTVQEEVGCRGAKTTANKINPDLGIAIDVGLAGDIPGYENETFQSKLGMGPLITLYDRGMIAHRGLRDYVINTAKENSINFQYAGLNGGSTDGSAIHVAHDGAPTLYVGLATRYIHSNVSVIHYDDIESTIELLVQLILKLNEESVSEITYK